MKKIFLTEQQIEQLQLLREGSRDNLLLPYLNILYSKGYNLKLGQLKTYLLNKFVTQANIHNLSLGSNFYLVGVARYYFNGDLTTNKELNLFNENITDEFIPEVCNALDNIILYLRNLYIDSVGTTFEQPEDFGELSIATLFKKYGKKAIPKEKKKKEEVVNTEPQNTLGGKINDKWSYEIMYSYKDCKKYKEATSPGAWRITYAEQHYRYYCKQYDGHFVIFYRNDYNDIPRVMGENSPLDEYGLSLIAVMQNNQNGDYINGTTRWNHGHNGKPVVNNDGFVVDYDTLKNVVGLSDGDFNSIFEEWKTNTTRRNNNSEKANETKLKKGEALRKLKYAQMLLNNGADPNTLFDKIYLVNGGKDGQYNFRRSIVSVFIKSNDNDRTYYALCDSGNIQFETLCECENLDPSYAFKHHGFDLGNYIIVCKTKKGCKFYDYIRHKLLIADGVTEFDRMSKFGVEPEFKKFACLYMNGGQAVYDLEKGEFMFDDPFYRSIYETVTAEFNNTFLCFCVDSSMGAYKWFYIKENTFIKDLDYYSLPLSYHIKTYSNDIIPLEAPNHKVVSLYNTKTKKFITDVKRMPIKVLSEHYVLLDLSLYCIDTQSFNENFGEYDKLNVYNKMYSNVYDLNFKNYRKRASYHLIFNADTGQFMKNDEGSIRFEDAAYYDEKIGWYTYNHDRQIIAIPNNFDDIVDFSKPILTESEYITNTINTIINENISEEDERNTNIDNTLLNEGDDDIDDVIQTFEPMKELNPKVWDEEKHLNKRVRLKLMDIANDFIDTLDVNWVKPKDIILTGSLANYNWSNYSDFDLHILMDFKKVDDRVEFVKQYFDSKKTIWNDLHGDIKIYGFPVEVYVQDINEEHTASGIYSLFKDKWIKEPSTDNFKSIQDDVETIKNKTEKYIGIIKKLEKLVRKNKDKHIDEVLGKKIKNVFNKIKKIRKESLKNGNEMSIGNLMFKTLRRMGYIERLIDLRNLVYNKINTIK